LLALTTGLLDSVPLDQIPGVEGALLDAAAGMPAALGARLESAEKLSDDDRNAVVDIVRRTIARFNSESSSKTQP
jgi:F-type H+-transporting ATPase subunit alpha